MSTPVKSQLIIQPRRIVVDQNPDGRDIYYDGRKYYYYPADSNKLLEAISLSEAKKGYFKKTT